MKSIGASLLLLLFLRNPYRGRCIFTVCLGGGTYLTARLPPINEVIPREYHALRNVSDYSSTVHIATRFQLSSSNISPMP